MSTDDVTAKERYLARFLTELDGRIEAIRSATVLIRASGLASLEQDSADQSDPLSEAVDEIYRHAHTIRGAAGTLGLEPARVAANVLAEVALHLNEDGMLADPVVWELVGRATDALASFGAVSRQGANVAAPDVSASVAALQAIFEERFAPPEDAADDFAEVARVLRLSDDEIEAFHFPKAQAKRTAPVTLPGQSSQEPVPAVGIVRPQRLPRRPLQTAEDGEAPEQVAQVLPLQLPAPPTGDETEMDETGEADLLEGVAAWPAAVEADLSEDVAAWPEDVAAPATPVAPPMVAIFCSSSLHMLEPVPHALAALAADRWDVAVMRTLRRAFHTIKGDGKQVGFEALAALAEAAEDVLDAVFEAGQDDPGARFGVPREALPLLAAAHDSLAAALGDPLSLVEATRVPDEHLLQSLLDVATLVGRSENVAPAQESVEREARRRRLLPVFLAEARRIVDVLHGHLDVLRHDHASIQALLGATRALHTLKGNASGLAIEAIVMVANAGESLLDAVAVNGNPMSPVQIDVLGDMEGALRDLIDTVDRGDEVDTTALRPLLAALAAESSGPSVKADPSRRSLSASKTEAATRFFPASGMTQPGPARPLPLASPNPVLAGADPMGQEDTRSDGPALGAPDRDQTVRQHGRRTTLTGTITAVDLADVEHSIDLFGRLVTTRTMLARGVEDVQEPVGESLRNSQRLRRIIDRLAMEFEMVRRERRVASHRDGWDALEMETFDAYAQIMLELGEIVADQEELAGSMSDGLRRARLMAESDRATTAELQQTLLGLRLVRFSTLEPRLDQWITTTARAVGKEVTWTLRGGSVAVDKAVLDALQEPLLHLLRNAVDHGLESPEERVARGKNATGAIVVEASYAGNTVSVRVVDDGRGIDPQHVAAVAVQRGLISAENAATLGDQAKLDLIWQPGFSTAPTVTEISGRGIGLDIVRNALTRGPGSVVVRSTAGQGTTFTISMPLSMSVVRTLLLRDGTATIAAPITQITGVHLLRAEDLTRVDGRPVAHVEGREVPVMEQGLGRPLPLAERLGRAAVVLIEVWMGAEQTVGFVVDEVLGEEDTLVKPLQGYLAHSATFVGCSVADNGRPYAIIDLQRLAEQWIAMDRTAGAPGRGEAEALAVAGAPSSEPLVLVVDDSVFMRRSLADLYESGGFRVATAEDGEAALAAIAQAGLPDLISLDMEMPRMNGLEMLSVLRQLPGGMQVPVFMISTRGQERHQRAALRAGVTRYFIKPYNGAVLLSAARDVCRVSQTGNVA